MPSLGENEPGMHFFFGPRDRVLNTGHESQFEIFIGESS